MVYSLGELVESLVEGMCVCALVVSDGFIVDALQFGGIIVIYRHIFPESEVVGEILHHLLP